MRRFPPLLEMIEGLVRTPSVSSVDPALDQGNRAVIDLLASWLDSSGFQVEIMPLAGSPAKANLIATLGSGPGGLVLAGHVDTVPYDVGKWTHDPFSLTEADARLYGLGSADMKSFLALALEASRDIQAIDLNEPLILLATADEETSMSGARALVAAQQPRARHAIIGEPTGLHPVRMHKGILMEAIRLHGHSGHSSDPSLGNSALEAMHTVIDSILTGARSCRINTGTPCLRSRSRRSTWAIYMAATIPTGYVPSVNFTLTCDRYRGWMPANCAANCTAGSGTACAIPALPATLNHCPPVYRPWKRPPTPRLSHLPRSLAVTRRKP